MQLCEGTMGEQWLEQSSRGGPRHRDFEQRSYLGRDYEKATLENLQYLVYSPFPASAVPDYHPETPLKRSNGRSLRQSPPELKTFTFVSILRRRCSRSPALVPCHGNNTSPKPGSFSLQT